jgi:hypothetical protein
MELSNDPNEIQTREEIIEFLSANREILEHELNKAVPFYTDIKIPFINLLGKHKINANTYLNNPQGFI